jgi:hypothetical protein
VARAAAAAWEVLRRGGSALDAVVLAATLLEDDPTFNAGTGATLTGNGDVELDASLMEGATLAAGAVACVKDVKNPVLLARAVLERSGHLLLVGEGASGFAREMGIPAWPNERLVIPQQRARFDAARGVKPATVGGGTIGVVARDRAGHLAAATSTGGTFLKRPGRVGDSPAPTPTTGWRPSPPPGTASPSSGSPWLASSPTWWAPGRAPPRPPPRASASWAPAWADRAGSSWWGRPGIPASPTTPRPWPAPGRTARAPSGPA